jgi:cytochrome c oxidase subunit 3
MVADPRLAHHFESLNKQAHANRLGMWLFLANEILLFGALFVGYAMYRHLFFPGFEAASHHLSKTLGTVDTFVLITSSFTMAMANHYTHHDRKNAATAMLIITILFGLGFLAIHSYEYWHDVHEGALPGRYFHVEGVHIPGASMFFSLYYIMTGLHSLHVLAGAIVLAILARKTWKGAYDSKYDAPLEMGGLYWHLVDLIWIFLYPLLYLIS